MFYEHIPRDYLFSLPGFKKNKMKGNWEWSVYLTILTYQDLHIYASSFVDYKKKKTGICTAQFGKQR